MMELRNRINRILFERGLAEGELASVCRLDQGHLNRIKNGRVKPSVVTALRIGRALGVPVDQIFFLDAGGGGVQDPAPAMRGNARAVVDPHGEGKAPARRVLGGSRG
jgi:DNA-binding XRE family transcriptional regulator